VGKRLYFSTENIPLFIFCTHTQPHPITPAHHHHHTGSADFWHGLLPTILRSVMEGASPVFDERPIQHRVRHQVLKQRSCSLFLALLAVSFLSITIFFAYNCSSSRPISSKLMFTKPASNILVLNVLSQVAMFCVAELALCVLDVLRWAFVSRPSGTSAYTFLALSRATNLAGVLYLILGKGPNPRRFQRDGHRLWGVQRYSSLSVRANKNNFHDASSHIGCHTFVRHIYPIFVYRGLSISCPGCRTKSHKH
jgi:hypothetical protein